MKRFAQPEFLEGSLEGLIEYVKECKRKNYAFVQLCAITRESSCELLYAFQDMESNEPGLEGYLVDVPDGVHVPSITEWYPAAFVFENETHDLFGVQIDGINIDFNGEFYTVAVEYPMNPRASQNGNEEADEDE